MALAIGGATVEELQDRMTHSEYLEWIAFNKHEPIGLARGDFQTAMLMTLLASINRGKGKRTPRLADFLPDWWDDNHQPSALAKKFRALTANVKTESARANNPGNTGRQVGRRRGRLRQDA